MILILYFTSVIKSGRTWRTKWIISMVKWKVSFFNIQSQNVVSEVSRYVVKTSLLDSKLLSITRLLNFSQVKPVRIKLYLLFIFSDLIWFIYIWISFKFILISIFLNYLLQVFLATGLNCHSDMGVFVWIGKRLWEITETVNGLQVPPVPISPF